MKQMVVVPSCREVIAPSEDTTSTLSLFFVTPPTSKALNLFDLPADSTCQGRHGCSHVRPTHTFRWFTVLGPRLKKHSSLIMTTPEPYLVSRRVSSHDQILSRRVEWMDKHCCLSRRELEFPLHVEIRQALTFAVGRSVCPCQPPAVMEPFSIQITKVRIHRQTSSIPFTPFCN